MELSVVSLENKALQCPRLFQVTVLIAILIRQEKNETVSQTRGYRLLLVNL